MGSIISNNSLFCGNVNSLFLRHNVIELNKKTYFYVGYIPSISLVHGGPAPSFFAEPVADYILYGLEKVKVSIADIQDRAIKRKLQKVNDLMWFIKNIKNTIIICKYSFGMLKTLSAFDSSLTPVISISG